MATNANPIARNLVDYFSTIGGDVIGAPKAVLSTITNPRQTIVDPMQQLVGQARDQFRSGHPVQGAVSAAESGIPFLGPMAAGITNDISKGDYGKAAGHLTSAAGLAELGDEAGSGARTFLGKQIGKTVKPPVSMGDAAPRVSAVMDELQAGPKPSARQAIPNPNAVHVTAHPGSSTGIQQIMDLVDTYGIKGKKPFEEPKLNYNQRTVPFPYTESKFAPASSSGIDRILDITDASRNGKIQPFSPSTVDAQAPLVEAGPKPTDQQLWDMLGSVKKKLADPTYKPAKTFNEYDSATPEDDLDIPAFLRKGNVPRLPSSVEDWSKTRTPTTDIGKYRSVEDLVRHLKNQFPTKPPEGK